MWSETKIQSTMIMRVHLLWILKICLMHWTMMYQTMTANPLWKCQSLKRVCAEQCVDLDSVRTIETKLTTWHCSRERIRNRCSSCCELQYTRWKVKKTSWRIVQLNDKLELYHDTKWAQSKQWRDDIFYSYAIGLRGSFIFPEYMRAGPCWMWLLLLRQSFIHVVSAADPLGLRDLLFVRSLQWRNSLAPLVKSVWRSIKTHCCHKCVVS